MRLNDFLEQTNMCLRSNATLVRTATVVFLVVSSWLAVTSPANGAVYFDDFDCGITVEPGVSAVLGGAGTPEARLER